MNPTKFGEVLVIVARSWALKRIGATRLWWLLVLKAKKIVYPEHDDVYLKECLENLKGKGTDLLL